MAKDKKTMVLDKYAQGMFVRQEQYALRVQSCYDLAVTKLLDLAAQVKSQYGDKAFRFSDNPRIQNETTQVIRQLYTQVYAQIKSGVETEWELANASCDALVGSCFNWKNSEEHFFARLFERNRQAMEQFFQRKSVMGGLNLSQKVWKYTSDLRTEMENAITVSLGEGVSSATMSRRVRQYLREPDRLYRRVRGADGKLHLSKNAKAFHPGAGVYRSSYKNAMRLTRTETNAAYRLAEEDRWQRMPFVVGIRINKSNNHPSYDVCDILCGDYPKDFRFSAFHPQCRCYVTPILCTPEELARYNKNILQGKSNDGFRSVNEVMTTPKVFNDWVYANRERIAGAKTLPYFLKDNGKIVDGKWMYQNPTADAVGTVVKNASYNMRTNHSKGFIEHLLSAPEPTPLYEISRKKLAEYVEGHRNLKNRGVVFQMRDTSVFYGEQVGNVITMSDHKMTVRRDGKKFRFNPAKNLENAFVKLEKGEPLLFEDEYAFECVWHEILHARAKGWLTLPVNENTSRTAMECVNQLCARKTYGDFIRHFYPNYEVRHAASILTEGYGYQKELKGLFKVLEKAGVSVDTVFEEFSGILDGMDYSKIKAKLKSVVESNGVKFGDWDNILFCINNDKKLIKYLSRVKHSSPK